MATISVPLSPKQQKYLDELVDKGVSSSRAGVLRKALDKLVEEEAINAVLQAEREISLGKGLRGDLKALLKKMP